MQNMPDDELQERVTKIMRSMRGMDALVTAIKSPQMRHSLYSALRDRFDLVSVADPASDKMFGKVLTSAGIGLLSLRDSDRKVTDTIGLVTEALRLSLQGGSPEARPAPALSAGAPPSPSIQTAQPPVSVPPPAAKTQDSAARKPAVAPQKPKIAAPASSPSLEQLGPDLRLFANLATDRKAGRRLDPLTLLLPGPARDEPVTAMTDWISGKPWAPDVLALRLAPTELSAIEEVADLEAEGFSAPKTLRDRTGLRPWMDTTGRARGISWLHGAGRDLGIYAITCDQALEAFRATLERTIETYWPAQAASLAAYGAKLAPGDEVPDLLASCRDIETFFLRETPDETGQPAQDLRGTISPTCAFSKGICYDRAAYLFLSGGLSLSGALMESLIELRAAQVIRDVPEDQYAKVLQGFDAVFFHDCARPLEDYKLACEVTQVSPEPMPEF